MDRAKGIVAVVVLGLLALAAKSTLPPELRPSAACVPHLRASLPLQIHGFDVSLPVTINGRAAQFGLDTGTSDSYILRAGRDTFALPDAPVPDSWNVGSVAGDRVQTEFVRVARLGFAGLEYAHRIMPVTSIAPEPGGTQVEDGTIGADLLKDIDVDLDIPHARIAFYSADPGCSDHDPPWAAKSTRVAIEPLGSGSPTIPVAYDGVTMPTLFATYWQRTLVRDFPVGTAGHPAIVPETPPVPLAPLAIMQTIAIGAMTDGPFQVRLWRKPPPIDYATHPDMDNVAILGFDVIRRHRFWLSLASKQLFVALPD